jgi:hypothetical protein
LSGFSKAAGKVISDSELEELRQQARTKHYAGKMTKRYKRYLKKQEKSYFQLLTVARALKKNL